MKRHIGELTTQSGLANALNITDRRVRQLADQGVIVREPDGGYDLGVNRRRYLLFRDRDTDRVADEVEEAAQQADEALDQLHNEPDLQKRRLLAQQVGFTIGQLDRAMRLANALAPEHARQMMETYTKMVVGRAAGAFLDACRWEIRDDEDEPAESPAEVAVE